MTAKRLLVALVALLLAAAPASADSADNDDWLDEFGGSTRPVAAAKQHLPAARAFDVSLGLGLGWGLPAGDFYKSLDSGPVYGADLRVAVSARHYLRVCYRRQNVLRTDVRVRDYATETWVEVDTSLDVDQYLALFGFLTSARPHRRTRAYAELGLGYGDHISRASARGVTASSHLGRVMAAFQFGGIFRLGHTSPLALDVGGYATAKIDAKNYESSGFVCGLQAGLMYKFGDAQ